MTKKIEPVFPFLIQGKGFVEIKASDFGKYWDYHVLNGRKLIVVKGKQIFNLTDMFDKCIGYIDPKKEKKPEYIQDPIVKRKVAKIINY